MAVNPAPVTTVRELQSALEAANPNAIVVLTGLTSTWVRSHQAAWDAGLEILNSPTVDAEADNTGSIFYLRLRDAGDI